MNLLLNSLKAIAGLFVAPLAAWIAIKMGWAPDETKTFIDNAMTIVGWVFTIGVPTAIAVWGVPNIKRSQQSEDGKNA